MDRDVERLERLLAGDASLDEETAELAELAQLASALHAVSAERPRAEFRTQLRDRLLLEAAELLPAPAPTSPPRERLPERVSRWRRSVSLTLASILSAGALSGVAVAAASQGAQPDDLLYDVKRATESLRLTLAGDRLATGRLHLMFAERRLSEVEAGARRLPPDMLIDTLVEMDEHSVTGARLLIDHSASTGETAPLRELAAFLDDQRGRLRALLPDLPVQVVPFAERSLRLVERFAGEAGSAVLPAAEPRTPTGDVDVDLPALPSITTSGDAPGEASTADSGSSSGPGSDPDEPAPTEENAGPVPSLTEEVGATVGDAVDDATGGLPDAETPLPGLESPDVTEPLDDLTETVEGTSGSVDDTLGQTVDDTVEGTVADTTSDPADLPTGGN